MNRVRHHFVAATILCASLFAAVHAAEDELPEIDLITGKAVGPVKLPAGAKAFSGATEEMGKLALSPDGKTAAGAGKDGKVRLFDALTAKLVATLDAEKSEVNGVAFSADGKSFFTAGEDNAVKQFDLDGHQVRQFGNHTSAVSAVIVSPDGRRLATTDSTGIRIWDLQSGAEVRHLTGHEVPKEITTANPLEISALAFSADGRILLSEANDETARLWDATSGKSLRTLPNHDGSVAAVALSPDGGLGISTRGNRQSFQSYGGIDETQPGGGRLRLWEVATGTVRRVLLGHRADLTCLAFTSDGRYILSGSHDRTLRQWEVDSGVELRRFKLVSSPIGVACAPDGKTAVTISSGEGLTVWDLAAPPRPTSGNTRVADLDDAWKKLASVNYDDRAAAMNFYLARPPAEATSDLSHHMQAQSKDAAAIQKAVEQLDNENYQLRLNAFEELSQFGADAREALAAALNHPSAEVRVRVIALLNGIGGPSDFRSVLVCEILGALKSPEAKTELTRIANAKLACSAHAKALLKK